MYYSDKIESLKSIFGTQDITLGSNSIKVQNKTYPIINDVIILCSHKESFAEDIQYTFSQEWKLYSSILPEHKSEFLQYFDIVDINTLHNLRICDLGCGIGRYSYFLKDICKELILIDFSDAIFIARKNLSCSNNCLFFMCNLKEIPFRENFADFMICLGVLHHLPTPCLSEVRSLKKFAPQLLIYIYYALDNRPIYFRLVLLIVTIIRNCLWRIKNQTIRRFVSLVITYLIYLPLIITGRLLGPLKLSNCIPIYSSYHNKSLKRIEQDVYDRFFTRIEQRVPRKDIQRLEDTFSNLIISEHIPYWHFLCKV